MSQLQCYHGHRFEVVTPADQQVVCPLCGSVTTPKAELHAPGPGPLDRTLVAPERAMVEAPFASEQNPASGPSVIVDASQAFDLTRDLPVLVKETPLPPAEHAGNRTVIFEAAASKADKSEQKAPVTERTSRPTPDAGVANSQTNDAQSGSLSSTTGMTSGSYSGTGSQSYSGARTTTAMQTEVDVTEPPNLPGYKVVNELGRGVVLYDGDSQCGGLSRIRLVALRTSESRQRAEAHCRSPKGRHAAVSGHHAAAL